MKRLGFILAALLWFANLVAAQTTTLNPSAPTNSTSVLAEETAERAWSFSASVYTYFVPDADDYAQPTITADRGWLHLEARYNYEAIETGSAWVGYNFDGGERIEWEVTPMLGGVFGDLNGIAPGYKGSLSWWKLELYTEGEFVFNPGDRSEDFFYSWSELSLAPTEWFRFGLVAQRTKAYETDFDIQRGFLVGFSFKRVDLTTYVFNPDDKPTVVLGLSVNF